MKNMSLKTASRFMLAAFVCASLAGCASSGTTSSGGTASTQDFKVPSISVAEKLYNKDPENAENALKYAAALREADYANRAAGILQPFANDSKSLPGIKTEFAAIQLAQGNNETAERYAQKAVLQNPEDAKAFHYLGIALDAQGKHPEAERAFRKALALWQGNATPVMNNLALNLSTQGQLDEATQILEEAKKLSPDRIEVERNLRIVRALRQSAEPTTPKPGKKPEGGTGIKNPVIDIEPAAAADTPPVVVKAPTVEVVKTPVKEPAKEAVKAVKETAKETVQEKLAPAKTGGTND